MNLGIVAAIAYGILALVGGVIGYKQAGSQVSLISGIVSGLLLILGGILQWQGVTWGWILSLVVTGLLIVVFISRYLKTRKPMPAVLMVVAGIVALVALLNAA
ncbi:TMEM14 family protein [Almyronema epifaneia]|uniref:TMEM14 family protein n=1 Tax=Almyronema epifaneia S1 TaxID=2991925 RepID=A0ABW6IGK7_9CYAN